MKYLSKAIFPALVVAHIFFRLVLTPMFAQEQQCADDLICGIQEQLYLAEQNLTDVPVLAAIE